MRLNLYIAKKYLWHLMSVSAFVMALVYLIDMVDYFGRFSPVGATIGQVIFFTIMRIPANFFQFLPLIVLLSALFCFFSLARYSEIVAIRAAGVPAVGFVFIPVILSGLIGLLFISALNPSLIRVNNSVSNFQNQITGETSFTSQNNGNWFRTKSEDKEYIYRLQKYNPDEDNARGISIYEINQNQEITEIHAKGIQFAQDEWSLVDALKIVFSDPINVDPQSNFTIASTQEIDKLFLNQNSPSSILNYDLPNFIQELEKDGYDIKEAKSYFYQQLAFPFFLMALCLIGSIFALAPPRFGGIAQRTIVTLLCGFATYSATMLAYTLGEAGTIPIWLSVSSVTLPAFFIALTLLLREEDG